MVGQPFWYRCRVVSVYDADSFRAVIDAGFRVLYTDGVKGAACRVAGIQAPELRSPNPDERAAARAARDAAEAWFDERLEGQHETWPFLIESHEFGKYGRVLCDVYRHGCEATATLGEHLIANGHAVPYDGGTKPTWGQP